MNVSSLVALVGRFGGYRLARLLTGHHPRILMYHRFSEGGGPGCVSAAAFEEQVRHIARFYKPMTISHMVNLIFEKKSLPRHAIAITIDDGYEDFYDVAWPILKRHGVPATFYVTTGFVSGRLWLWPDQLKWIIDNAPDAAERFTDGEISVDAPGKAGSTDQTFKRVVAHLLSIDDQRKHTFIQSLAESWKLALPESPPKAYAAATWDQLREMQADGLEIGGHTMTHPSLGRVDSDQAELEIGGCSEEINDNLGHQTRSFCYPNGKPEDFSGEHVPFVKAAGFSGAVVAFSDASRQDQRYAMRRHSSSRNMFQFMKAVSGIELLGNWIRRDKTRLEYES